MSFQTEIPGRGDASHAAPDDHGVNFVRHLALVDLVDLVDSVMEKRFYPEPGYSSLGMATPRAYLTGSHPWVETTLRNRIRGSVSVSGLSQGGDIVTASKISGT